MECRRGWMLIGIGVVALGCQTASRSSVGCREAPEPTSRLRYADKATAPKPDNRLARLSDSAEITSGTVRWGDDSAETTAEDSELELVSNAVTDHDVTRSPVEQTSSTPVPLSLASAVSLALERNPDLIAIRQTDNVGAAALGVAQTYPFNPYVQVQATPYQNTPGNNGPGTTYHYVLLMQTIQLAHQQQYREEGAAASLNTTRWNIHQAELLNVAQTERLYFTALYLKGLSAVAAASDANNQELLGILEKRLAAGDATAADVAIVRIDARSTRQQARLAKANYLTALRDLRRQLNLPPDSAEEPAGDLTAIVWREPTSDTLASQWGASDAFQGARDTKGLVVGFAAARPDVMAARSDVDLARAGFGLASASRTPDLQVGPYYQRTVDGTTFLGLRAQMDLPVVNNGAPLQNQRACELHQRVAVWQQLQARAELEAEAAFERYALALSTVSAERDAQQMSLPEELRKLEEQFNAREVDVVRIIQARTSTLQNQRAWLDLLNELAQSAANLTAATGIGPESLLSE